MAPTRTGVEYSIGREVPIADAETFNSESQVGNSGSAAGLSAYSVGLSVCLSRLSDLCLHLQNYG